MLLTKIIEKFILTATKAIKLFGIIQYLKANRSFNFENNKR